MLPRGMHQQQLGLCFGCPQGMLTTTATTQAPHSHHTATTVSTDPQQRAAEKAPSVGQLQAAQNRRNSEGEGEGDVPNKYFISEHQRKPVKNHRKSKQMSLRPRPPPQQKIGTARLGCEPSL